MPGLTKKSLLILPVVAAVTVLVAAPFYLKGRLHDTLADYGLTDIRIKDWKPGPGQVVFSGITLDPNGFNKIDSVKAQINWLAPFSGRFFPRITIDDLDLTGEVNGEGHLAVEGWQTEKLQTSSPVPQTIVLNGGRFELYTPEGGLVFNSKGKIEKTDHLAINAALWGKQHQLTLDTRWQVAYYSAQNWRSEIEIRDLRLNLDELQCSRVSGWLTATRMPEDIPGALPALSGQITAGAVKIGKETALQNVSLTFSGAGSTIVTAESSTHSGVEATLEINNGEDGSFIRASLSGYEIKDTLSFLEDFAADIEKGTSNRVNFVTLLLTPGNIERIEKEVARISYDNLEVIIEGEPNDLTGKVLARKKKNGDFVTSVISMNPGG